jgi:hypothetical protein
MAIKLCVDGGRSFSPIAAEPGKTSIQRSPGD